MGGVFAVRAQRWWALCRRGGAVLGIVGLLTQALLLAFHHPAQAAPISLFNDPGAWCGVSADGAGGPSSDRGVPKTPLHHGGVCPICQSLQAAGPGLLPVLALLVAPGAIAVSIDRPAETGGSPRFGGTVGNPRAPPPPSDRV